MIVALCATVISEKSEIPYTWKIFGMIVVLRNIQYLEGVNFLLKANNKLLPVSCLKIDCYFVLFLYMEL